MNISIRKNAKQSARNSEDIPLRDRLKVIINQDGYEAWGITSIKQKTAYAKDKADTLATEEDMRNNNYRYPGRYFAYYKVNDKPTLFVENRDKLKDGTYSERYFKPATIVFHKTNKKWTHNDRITDQPFLSCVMYTDANGKELPPTQRLTLSVRYGERFHVDNKHKFIVDKIPKDEKIVSTSRLCPSK